jgi:hypothetical protein
VVPKADPYEGLGSQSPTRALTRKEKTAASKKKARAEKLKNETDSQRTARLLEEKDSKRGRRKCKEEKETQGQREGRLEVIAKQRAELRRKKCVENWQQPLSQANPESQSAAGHSQDAAVGGEDGDMSDECA